MRFSVIVVLLSLASPMALGAATPETGFVDYPEPVRLLNKTQR